MRVALISRQGGDDPRAMEVARELRLQGHQATFLVPQTELGANAPTSAPSWQAEGFAWIPVGAVTLSSEPPRYPSEAWFATARVLAEVVFTFDAAWFFEAEWAMIALRNRRFHVHHLPLIVLENVQTIGVIPKSLEDVNRTFAREYSTRLADLVFTVPEGEAPKPAGVRVHLAKAQWRKLCITPERTRRPAKTTPAVTVCVPYYEKAQFLPETLLSLEQQTSTSFTVVVVDDGSTSEEARSVFSACRERYTDRDWRFISQDNSSAGGARNRAAYEAQSEYLLFLDADDIAEPRCVETFLQGALLTGDDCLVARNYVFREDPQGPCVMLYDPPGNSLIGSMGDDMHGGSCMLFRRDAFIQLGGFTEMKGVGFEDYEIHVRANLQGFSWDVLPGLIYRYRAPQQDGISRSTSAYSNLARVSRWYRDRLLPHGLGQLPIAFASAYWNNDDGGEALKGLQQTLSLRRAKPTKRRQDIKLLLLACNFPFGMASGWHTRLQQMIRYLGSRYQVTLMTAMPREQLEAFRKETFLHLHAVIGIEGSDVKPRGSKGLPSRVQEHYTQTYIEALSRFPSNQYHAAIMDQIFMAEFRHHLDTVPVLTEQNIESQLLRQVSKRIWNNDVPMHYQHADTQAEILEQYETRAWADFPLRSVVSRRDRDEVKRRVPSGTTVIAPNGADPSSWIRDTHMARCTVLFAGNLSYLPNVDAVTFLLEEVWPSVKQHTPGAKLLIAGRDPLKTVRLAIANAGADQAGIELVATPADMRRIARRSSVSIAPLRIGSGTRCKILESMAWGLPVVSTTLGAEGIDVENGQHLLLRDDPEDFAEAIVHLLSNEQLWRKLRFAGANLIQERYSWDRVFDPFDEALMNLVS